MAIADLCGGVVIATILILALLLVMLGVEIAHRRRTHR
jgi:hypothetical protein